MKQKTLFKISEYNSEFGGSLIGGRRKSRRPLSGKNTLHLVLRADTKKSGSLLKYRATIDRAFTNYANRFGIKIYKKAIVSNHIHIVALFRSRQQYVAFIRSFSGVLARQLKIKWLLRPWTRILNWGKAFNLALKYTLQNHLEAIGKIPYQKRRINPKTKIQLNI